MAAKVVHVKKSAYDVYVGRPSKWGNPFTVSEYGRSRALAEYLRWVYEPSQDHLRQDAKLELRNKILACWCSPHPCHGDILLEIANEPA